MYLRKRDGLQGGMIAAPIAIVVLFLVAIIVLWWKKYYPKSVLYVPKKQKNTSNSRPSSGFLHFLRHGFRPSKPSSSNPHQDTSYAPSTHSTTTTTDPTTTEMLATTDAPNRNRGSLRSILTLPTYHPSPLPNEQLIAVAGERAGVDTVIEYPETLDEEEARREADMASLYEIRQARRREINARNDRRAARAEARRNGDYARLEQLRLEDIRRQRRDRERSDSGASLTLLPSVSTTSTMPELGTGGNNASSQSLIAEHNLRTSSRDRRVSSVSYADLGLARHDGSRLRESSIDSDHRPLLEGAGSMGTTPARPSGDGGSSTTSRRGSLFTTPPATRHHRGVSAESVVSTESDLPPPGGGAAVIITPQTSSGERSGSSGSEPTGVTPSGSEPSPELPMEDPPGYEDAPPYSSPVAGRGEGVPTIEISESGEPVAGAGGS